MCFSFFLLDLVQEIFTDTDVLKTLPRPSGRANRMIFTDIKPDSFTWRWQGTTDGKAWADSWGIRYTRKKAG